MAPITIAQFLAGQTLAYRGFSGAELRATWSGAALVVRDVSGRRLTSPRMARHLAESFYAGIVADPSASIEQEGESACD